MNSVPWTPDNTCIGVTTNTHKAKELQKGMHVLNPGQTQCVICIKTIGKQVKTRRHLALWALGTHCNWSDIYPSKERLRQSVVLSTEAMSSHQTGLDPAGRKYSGSIPKNVYVACET